MSIFVNNIPTRLYDAQHSIFKLEMSLTRFMILKKYMYATMMLKFTRDHDSYISLSLGIDSGDNRYDDFIRGKESPGINGGAPPKIHQFVNLSAQQRTLCSYTHKMT